MSTIPRSAPPLYEPLELHNGDRMTQEEFHRVYEKMPKHVKAELIGGIVYMASPLRIKHAATDPAVIALLFAYAARTPGTQVCNNATVKLGGDSEVQPDVFLRVLPEFGGQSGETEDGYVSGAPELVAEVAHSSRAIDLGSKRKQYIDHGVREYIVLTVSEPHLYWFDLSHDLELQPGTDGILHSQIFPGLWIDRDGLLARDFTRIVATLDKGVATPEHAEFVAKLAEANRQRQSK